MDWGSTVPTVIGRSLGGLMLLYVAHFFYRCFTIRLRFSKLRRQGLPVPEPYSLVFGHIPLMKKLRDGLPKDAHDTYVARKLCLDWQEYFPNASTPPPVAYLDLWPFLSQPLIMVFSPQACSQLTQITPQPRHSLFKWSLTPLTGGQDLTSIDVPSHRMWRSRLNPGFSPKALISHMDVLLEEVVTFVDRLEPKAGDAGTWGDVFTLYDDVVNLTFDIIFRVTLDYRTNEQTDGPSPLFTAIRRLTTHVKKPTLITRLERYLPAYRRDVAQHTKTINDILVPHIQDRLSKERQIEGRQTVVDLCLKQISTELNEKNFTTESSKHIDVVLSQVKVFILAGHHTTAQAICWAMYEVHKKPGILKKLREEHDEILGPKSVDAQQILSKQPHRLNDLRYTAAVIKETLRVHSLSQTHREGSSSFKFSIDNVIYPTEDTMIQTIPAATHARPDLWPRATEFLPDRFLVDVGHDLYPPKNAWRPFELGSTRCIGEELAMMELKLVLVFALRNLDFDFGSMGQDDRLTQSSPRETVDGNYIYRVGNGLGYVKDNLPTRVKVI